MVKLEVTLTFAQAVQLVLLIATIVSGASVYL
jgi:hypothetical protein